MTDLKMQIAGTADLPDYELDQFIEEAFSICQRNMTAMNLPGYRKQRKRSEKTVRC